MAVAGAWLVGLGSAASSQCQEVEGESFETSQATALGLLLLEREASPLASLRLEWWELLRPGSRSPVRLEEVPEQLEALRREFGLGGVGAGVREPIAPAQAEAFVAGVWRESRERLRALDEAHPMGVVSWAPRSKDEALAVLERIERVQAEAELRLQALELALAVVDRQERSGLFERQLWLVHDHQAGASAASARSAPSPGAVCWPELAPLGQAFSVWVWSLGVVQSLSWFSSSPLRPHHVPQVAEELLGSSLEGRCWLAFLERALCRGSRVGTYGLRWVTTALYGPAGLWAPVPSLREPLMQLLPRAAELVRSLGGFPAEELAKRHGSAQGLAPSQAAGSGPGPSEASAFQFELVEDEAVSLFQNPAVDAVAVGAAEALRRMDVLIERGFEALGPQSLAAAPSGLVALQRFPLQQAQALALWQERLERHRQLWMGSAAECSLLPFEAGLSRELICSLTALFLRHGKALVTGRFAREPGLLRQEFSAFCVYRLALWDGTTISALQEALQPLPSPLARAMAPETRRAVSRDWQGSLGFPSLQGWGPADCLPALSEAQWLDWRVREFLVPLARAVLTELYAQLLVVTDQRRGELSVEAAEAAAARVAAAERELEVQKQLTAPGVKEAVAAARSRGLVQEWGLQELEEAQQLDFSAYAKQVLVEGLEGQRQRGQAELGLMALLAELAPAQQLQLQAPWVEEVLPPVGAVRLRPFLLEGARLLEVDRRWQLRPSSEESLEPLAERLNVEVPVLAAWLAAQPFKAWEAREVMWQLSIKGFRDPSRFGGLAETLLSTDAPHLVAPRWLQRACLEQA